MARKLRVHFEGAIYHVTLRGVERRRLFDDDDDRERFIDRLGVYAEECRIRLYMFCLMTNHVHLLLETPEANLSVFMQKLQTAYTIYYNLRHDRTGHLLQGRFGAKLVEGNEYLLMLSRYIHLNPVYVNGEEEKDYAERRACLRAYSWSSYPGYAGLTKPFEMVTEGPILSLVEGEAKKQRLAYRRFVEAAIAQTDEEFLSVLRGSSLVVGGDDFRERVQEVYAEAVSHARHPEDASFRKTAKKIAPDAILKLISKHFGVTIESLCMRNHRCIARAVAASLLVKYTGMNQREIGEWLTMGTGSAVSQQIRRLRARQAEDPALAATVCLVERAALS